MSYQFITSEQGDDGIVVVTINDPDAKNAVNWEMNQEIPAETVVVTAENIDAWLAEHPEAAPPN